MSKYQLPQAEYYILKWVQWAVCCDATSIAIEIDSDWVSLGHDGRSEALNGVLNISDMLGLLHDQTHGGSHLAVGAFAARALKPKGIVFNSRLLEGDAPQRNWNWPNVVALYQPQPSKRLASLPSFVSLALKSERPEPVASDDGGSTWKWLRDLPNLLRTECALVRYRCIYCPVPLTLNGRAVNHPYFGASSSHRWQGSILQVEPLFRIADPVVCYWDKEASLPGWGPHGELATLHLRGGPACRTLWLAYGNGSGKGSYQSETVLVKHGVILERVSTLFGPPFPVSAMVICVDLLETDLSSFKVLRNQTAQVFWEAIRLQVSHSSLANQP